jgi:thiol:disulfide interchange protein DsbD
MRIWAFISVLAASAVFAQGAYQIQLKSDPEKLSIDQPGRLIVDIRLSKGYHATAPDNGLFAVEPEPAEGVLFGKPEYPAGEQNRFGAVYNGKIQVKVPFKIQKNAEEGVRTLAAKVTIQQCAETQGVCYLPEDTRVETKITIMAAKDASAPAAEEGGKKDIAGRVANALDKGSSTAFLLVFLGGLLTGFTPCVYPMIPITIAVIGARTSGTQAFGTQAFGTQAFGNKLGGFVLSLFYVLGIALTFSVLGMVAAKTGALFGSAMNHPIVTILVAAIFFLMGLSMLGAFVMQMPPALASKLRAKKRKGFIGTFFTGMIAGLVVSPCISPLLVVILTWVAKRGSLMLGFGLLFSFALGLGVLFIVIGTFSGALRTLPKSGPWMKLIESGFGILLITLAVMFLKPILSQFLYTCLWAVYLVFLGTFLGAFTSLDKGNGRRQKTLKAVAVLLVIIGSILLFYAVTVQCQKTVPITETKSVVLQHEGIAWIFSESEALQQVRVSGKSILMDFFAEWCTACRELDEKTWPDESVQKLAAGFVPLKLDMTKKNEATSKIQKKYNILGMPTVILMSAEGKEFGRFAGFKPPKEVAEFLRKYVQ